MGRSDFVFSKDVAPAADPETFSVVSLGTKSSSLTSCGFLMFHPPASQMQLLVRGIQGEYILVLQDPEMNWKGWILACAPTKSQELSNSK